MNRREWSFQEAGQSLTGSALRVVEGLVSGRDAHALAQHVLNLAETPDGQPAAPMFVREVRGAVASLWARRAPVDPATEYAMMNAELAAQWMLLAGPSPASGPEPTPVRLTTQVRALSAQLRRSAASGSPHGQEVALRRVLANLYALAATAGHPSQPAALRTPVAALVGKAGTIVESGGSRTVVEAMKEDFKAFTSALQSNPSTRKRLGDTVQSLERDLESLRVS